MYKPLVSRVQGIMNIKLLISKKQVRIFISSINFIKNHILNCAKIIKPLTWLMKDKVKFEQSEEEQHFYKIKAKYSEAIILVYPKVNESFHLCTNACDTQVGRILIQDRNTLVIYSTKLNEVQKKYPIMDKELLTIDKFL